ncbi:hypothetical protein TNCV_797941 [Trichonephila clavipes]|nr:hypothetical protein TNCV_797941 [Trichonephila clavipes]
MLLNSISNAIAGSTAKQYRSLTSVKAEEDLVTIGKRILQFFSRTIPSEKINETLLNSISKAVAGSTAKHYQSLILVNEEEDLETIGKEMLQFLSKIIPSSKINETLLNNVSNAIAGSTAKQTIPSEKINETLLNSISKAVTGSTAKHYQSLILVNEEEDLETIGKEMLQFLSKIIPSSKINETLLNNVSNAISGSTAKQYRSLTSVKAEEDLVTIGKILQFFSRTIPSEKINKTLLNSISKAIAGSTAKQHKSLTLVNEGDDFEMIGKEMFQFLSKIIPSTKINEMLLNSISNAMAGSTAKQYRSLTSVKAEEDLVTIGKRILQFFSRTIPSEKINETLLNSISNAIAGSTAKQYQSLTLVNEEEDLEAIGKEMLQFLSKIIPSSKINETLLNNVSNAIAGSTAKQYRSLTLVKAEEDLVTIGKRILQLFSRTIPSEKIINETLLNSISKAVAGSTAKHYQSLILVNEEEDLETIGKEMLQFLSKIIPSSKINETLLNNVSNAIAGATAKHKTLSELNISQRRGRFGSDRKRNVAILVKIIPSSKINETLLNNVSNAIAGSTAKQYRSLTLVKAEEDLVTIGKRILQLFSRTIPSEKINETLLNSISKAVTGSTAKHYESLILVNEEEDLETIGKEMLQFLSKIIPSSKINETLLNNVSNAISGSSAKQYRSLTSVKAEEDLVTIGKRILQFFSRTIPSEKINETLLNSISKAIAGFTAKQYKSLTLVNEGDDFETIGKVMLQFLSKLFHQQK